MGKNGALRVYLIGVDPAAALALAGRSRATPRRPTSRSCVSSRRSRRCIRSTCSARCSTKAIYRAARAKGVRRLVRVSALVPTVAAVYRDRPAILTPVAIARARHRQLRCERRRVDRRASGKVALSGKLPFDLPSTILREAQRPTWRTTSRPLSSVIITTALTDRNLSSAGSAPAAAWIRTGSSAGP